MRVDKDEFTSRTIAEDAFPAIETFRRSGGRSFHQYSVEEVRRMYVESCEAAPLIELHTPEQGDFQVGAFRVRLYDPRPKTKRSNPTAGILFIHGGGWVMGNLRTHHFMARRLSARTGLPLLAVDYRLAPEHRYPAAIDDCREALAWFSERVDLHGVQLSSLSLIGDSAGGQLAAVLTNEAVAGAFSASIDSQVLLYPVTDLTEENITTSTSYQRVVSGFPLVAETMKWFADAYVGERVDRSTSDLSPLQSVLPEGLPASYVITVDNDPLAEEGARYVAKLATAGAPVQYEHLVGYAHGLFTSAGRIPTGEHYVNKVADFIVKNTSV